MFFINCKNSFLLIYFLVTKLELINENMQILTIKIHAKMRAYQNTIKSEFLE